MDNAQMLAECRAALSQWQYEPWFVALATAMLDAAEAIMECGEVGVSCSCTRGIAKLQRAMLTRDTGDIAVSRMLAPLHAALCGGGE
jgi:hypothetical protein